MPEVRSGTDNGVCYTYTCEEHPCSAAYLVRVHRVLLDDASLSVFCTKPFRVGGHEWRLKLVKRKDGYLATTIVPSNKAPIKAHYSLAVRHPTKPELSAIGGWTGSFRAGTERGYSHFVKTEKMIDFLKGDVFEVELILRIQTPEDEQFSVSPNGVCRTVEWRVKDLQHSSYILCSPVFRLGQTKWRLSMHPKGRVGTRDQCGLYLYSLNDSFLRARFVLHVLDPVMRTAARTYEMTGNFPGSNTYAGWRDALTTQEASSETSGFVKDGWLSLFVQIKVEGAPSDNKAQRKHERHRMCVVCGTVKQTSGFVHSKTSHKCVCGDCCLRFKRQKLHCPVCCEKIDDYVLEYYPIGTGQKAP